MRTALVLFAVLVGCASRGPEEVQDSSQNEPASGQQIQVNTPTVTMVVRNTTGSVQYVEAWGSVGIGWPETITGEWRSGVLELQPGESRTFSDVIDAPKDSRLKTDIKVYTGPRLTSHSGRGFDMVNAHGKSISCELGTSDAEWPNAAVARCASL